MNISALKPKKDLLFIRLVSVFFLVAAAITILLTTLLFAFFSGNFKREMYRVQETNLKQMSAVVGFRAEYVNSLLVQVKSDDQISKLFFTKDPILDSTIVNRLNEVREPTKHLNSIYVCNDYTDTIYCSSENKLPFVNSKQFFEDKGFVELLDHISDYPKYTPILRKVTLEWPSGQSYDTYVYTYLIYDSYSTGAIHNVVAFNFHLGWIEDALDLISVDGQTGDRMWIVNGERTIVYTSDGKLIGTECDKDALPSDILGKASGYRLMGDGDEMKMLTYATPSRMGYENWTFVSWTDYAKLMQPLENVKRIIIGVSAIVLLASLVAIFIITNILYEPFRKTIAKVGVLEEEKRRKQLLERELFLQQLFLGNAPDDAGIIRENFKKHEVNTYPDGNVMMLVLSIDDVERFYDLHRIHLDETHNTVSLIIGETFRSIGVQPLCVRMHGSMWAMCVPADEFTCQKQQVFDGLNARLHAKLDVTASLAVSSAGHSVLDIPFLYSEALNVLSYRLLRGKNCLLDATETREHEQTKYIYPDEVEKKLMSNLFGGKYDETMELYQNFLSVVLTFSVDDIRLAFMQLAHAIKAASAKSIAEASGALAEFDRFYRKLGDAETIDEINAMFSDLFDDITGKLKQKTLERHEALVEQIMSYVEEYYGDLNLSINDISDNLDMSAAYLGRLFKQVTGTTFIEYLTKYRLKAACELLTGTDMTVNEVSDKVGFTNCSYFYIIFKKNLECTPNQYRKQNNGGEDA